METETTERLSCKSRTTAEKLSNESGNLLEQDPLIEPLIDTDDLAPTSNSTELVSELSSETTESTTNKSCSRLFSRCKGITYAVLSSTIFTLSTFIIKQLGVDLYDALLCRFSIQCSILTVFMFYKRYKLLYGTFSLISIQITRAVFSCAGILLLCASYNYIPLPDLITVRYTQVIWTAIIAMIIFRERISTLTIIAILFTFTGVICVAQPTFLFNRQSILTNQTLVLNQSQSDRSEKEKSFDRLLGFSLALACSISFSLGIVLNKRLLILKIPHSVIIYQFALITLIVLLVHHFYHRFYLHSYDQRSMFTWQYVAGASVSLFQLYSSTIIQKSFKLEHPSIVTIAQSSDILFAVLLQNLFTNEKSNGLVLIGAAFVTTSIVLVALEKFWKDTKKTTKIDG